MGRPIKKKYYNPAPYGYSPQGDGAVSGSASIGGEQIAAGVDGNITLNSLTKGLGYYTGNVYAQIAAPLLADGTQATIDVVHLWANGAVKAFHLDNPGKGYTVANPAITVYAPGLNGNTTPATATATLTASTSAPAIRANVFFTGASSGDWNADMIKQRGSKTWVCKNASYTQTVKLVTNDANLNPYSAGTMTMIGTFADASQFSIAKITDRKVYSSTGQSYKWTFDSVSGTGNVSTTNITVQVQSS
jgi:hypothetical protein